MIRLLLLAGTSEATHAARQLTEDGADVISSLAGITTSPVQRVGRVRSGGFGGVDGLSRYLTDHCIDALIDATHPFATVMPFNAAIAAKEVGVPHCRLLRAPWTASTGDLWVHVSNAQAAAMQLAALGAERVFLAVGRQTASHFSDCRNLSFLVRAIEPIDQALPGAHVLLQRGPFQLEQERQLLIDHKIDTIVAKNSGGVATGAKLIAARELGVRVVMIARPPQPNSEVAASVDDAVRWFRSLGTPSSPAS